MTNHLNRMQWVLLLGLALGLTGTSLTHAGQSKANKDLEADDKQAAQEEADEAAAREKGTVVTYQKLFMGTFVQLAEANEKVSPEVVGVFITNEADKKPGRSYQVKVQSGNKEVLAALYRLNQKRVQVTGKLRVIDANGEGKYLIVSSVLEAAPTPPVAQRRKAGGI
ncbi:MAG TPA: hypothetical protein VEK08_14010 [Planctomycetota bacterium]|nr:hypothetical protein [Planctomycetota bacterium]